MRCAGCSRTIPSDAAFCMYCATPMGEGTPAPRLEGNRQPRPATGPTVRLQPADARRAVRPTPPVVVTRPSTPPPHHKHQQRVKRHKQHDPSFGIFMLGLGVLWFTNSWWPGILILLGIASFFKYQARGRFNQGLSHLVFWIGVVLLLNTSFIWPGVIPLMILTHYIGKQRKSVTIGKQRQPVTFI